jgi:hypothetical protein
MSSFRKTLTVLLFTLLITVSANAQKVSVGADPGVDLTKYKTYGWSNIASANPLTHETVVSAIDAELAAKGLRKVDTDPELTVVVFGSTASDVHASNPSWAPALNSIATGVAAGSQSFLITKGTLVVDLVDTKTKNSVWRGQATDTLDHGPTGDKVKDAKNVEKPIKNAVKKMFKQFPHPKRK